MNEPAKPQRSWSVEHEIKRVGVILGWMLIVAGACFTLFLLRGFIARVFNVLTPFLAAAVLAYILDPVIAFLQTRFRMGRIWGLIVCYSGVALLIAMFMVVLVPAICRQAVAAYEAMASVIPAVAERWFQSSLLSESDLKDPRGLAAKISRGADPVSQYLSERLPPAMMESLKKADLATTLPRTLQSALVEELNKQLGDEGFYDPQRFKDIKMKFGLRRWLDAPPWLSDPSRRNRKLLEVAYPDEIAHKSAQASVAGSAVSSWSKKVRDALTSGTVNLQDIQGALPGVQKLIELGYGQFQSVLTGLWGGVNYVFSFLTLACFIVIISFYFILDFDKFGYFMGVVIPERHAPRIFDILGKIDQAVGGFLRGQLIVCCTIGALTTFGLLILGLVHTPALAKYCLLIGIAAGIANFVPYLGTILMVAVAILTILFTPGEDITWAWRLSGLIGVGILGAINQVVEGFILQPYVVGPNSNLHPIVVMLALFAGLQFGLGGLIVAVPVAAIIRVLLKELWWDRRAEAYQRRVEEGED
ncbi:MAG: AI-2E family transporter [Candidatus Sumerlaeota bacterium]|nr:AI-2E family transporter [Candidatus Sumerlaeota bacterium]